MDHLDSYTLPRRRDNNLASLAGPNVVGFGVGILGIRYEVVWLRMCSFVALTFPFFSTRLDGVVLDVDPNSHFHCHFDHFCLRNESRDNTYV